MHFLNTFVKDQLAADASVFFCNLYSVPLVYMSVIFIFVA